MPLPTWVDRQDLPAGWVRFNMWRVSLPLMSLMHSVHFYNMSKHMGCYGMLYDDNLLLLDSI